MFLKVNDDTNDNKSTNLKINRNIDNSWQHNKMLNKYNNNNNNNNVNDIVNNDDNKITQYKSSSFFKNKMSKLLKSAPSISSSSFSSSSLSSSSSLLSSILSLIKLSSLSTSSSSSSSSLPRSFINLSIYVIVIVVVIVATIVTSAEADNNHHHHHNRHHHSHPVFTNEWVIEVKGGEEVAREVAQEHHLVFIDKVIDDFYLVKHKRLSKRSIKSTYRFNRELSADTHISWFQQQVAKIRVKRDVTRVSFNDPKWPRMWYMNQYNDNGMNIMAAWKRGYTGKNVVVSILDDGIEKDHPDLKKNYDPEASYDVNDRDPDPQPRYDTTNENKHGTRCAGEVAAESNNGLCGTGVAFNARIGGVRMLDGDVTDAVEAKSLGWNPQHVDIYSASWGPDDDGKTVDGPGPITARAFEDGITTGRRGLGSIFVWASGNGGQQGDDCNCDGYTNLIYTLSISGVSEYGQVPWYSESCSSALASAYSSGSASEKQIVTTDLNRQCTENHTGTSASAPLAVGMIALTLEANPFLTWRDVQHVIVLSAKKGDLETDDWKVNGADRFVSHRFGFGLMDVGRMIDLAENWTSVPTQKKCIVSRSVPSKGLSVNNKLNISLNTSVCQDTEDEVNYLEHVQVIITLTTQRRGEMEIFLTSPSGTKSTLLGKRPNDFTMDGFVNWTFMTTHCWGEDGRGTWKLEIRNSASLVSPSRLQRWTLIMYGTKKEPYASPLLHLNPRRPPMTPMTSHSSSSSSSLSSSLYRQSHFHNNHHHHHHRQQQQQPHYSSSGGSKSASYNDQMRPHFYKIGLRSNIQSEIRHDKSSVPNKKNHNKYHNYQNNDIYYRDNFQYNIPSISRSSSGRRLEHCKYLSFISFICSSIVFSFKRFV